MPGITFGDHYKKDVIQGRCGSDLWACHSYLRKKTLTIFSFEHNFSFAFLLTKQNTDTASSWASAVYEVL